MDTALREFVAGLRTIAPHSLESQCVGVLDKIKYFPRASEASLRSAHDTFWNELTKLGWDDVGRWIESWLPSYTRGLEDLARASTQAHDSFGAHFPPLGEWNTILRQSCESSGVEPGKVLCAFSSAVDATYALDSDTGLAELLPHMCGFLRARDSGSQPTVDKLLQQAFKLYQRDPHDRTRVSTVAEVLAEIMFAFEHPRANLKPTLIPGSEAEDWGRSFLLETRKAGKVSLLGGGASVNIADALAGLYFSTHVFWPYHPNLLASSALPCTGKARERVLRCWFDDSWVWRQSPFTEEGGGADLTGHPHPVRLSLVLRFSPASASIAVPGTPRAIRPQDHGRLILQFGKYYSSSYFDEPGGTKEEWPVKAVFSRWRYGRNSHLLEDAPESTMTGLPGYHRVILSAFQRAGADVARALGEQCRNMRIHHEISASFKTDKEVRDYCRSLNLVYAYAAERTAGMNSEELASFTSWETTQVFAATLPAVTDTLLQCMFRARTVRQFFNLKWLLVHGNDIDITVVTPGMDAAFMEGLRRAMLLAKVAVFAALHVRSGLIQPVPAFGLTCSPKGMLGLYQFARDFTKQYEECVEPAEELYRQILLQGYVTGKESFVREGCSIPAVVVVPVYWPDPLEGCSMTGAGDIVSGVTAAAAP